MCLELRPSVHWSSIVERIFGSLCVSNVLSMVFLWSSSVLQILSDFHCIATGTPFGASIPQCGSGGIPVYLSLQWSSSVCQLCKCALDCHWKTTGVSQCYSTVVCLVVPQCTESDWVGGQQVRSLPSMQPPIYTTGITRVVWAKLISFELQPQIHKTYTGAHIKACTEWC